MPTASLHTVGTLLIACLSLATAHIPTQAAEPPPTSSLPLIFNGRDLTGWQVPAEPYWQVADGVLIGQSDEQKKGSMLYTERCGSPETLTAASWCGSRSFNCRSACRGASSAT